MNPSVLVVYASERGSTREVAETVAATLREQRLDVDLHPAAATPDRSHYAAVVIGGARYMGRWHGDARRFYRRRRIALAAVAIFGDVVDPAKLGFAFKRLSAPDARDWDAIRAWASELPRGLGLAASASAMMLP
jgi:Flavodoxin domain